MTRFFTFILAVVMISGGVSFAFAQQAQPRYVVSPFAPFFNFGNRSSGPTNWNSETAFWAAFLFV